MKNNLPLFTRDSRHNSRYRHFSAHPVQVLILYVSFHYLWYLPKKSVRIPLANKKNTMMRYRFVCQMVPVALNGAKNETCQVNRTYFSVNTVDPIVLAGSAVVKWIKISGIYSIRELCLQATKAPPTYIYDLCILFGWLTMTSSWNCQPRCTRINGHDS